MNRLLPLIVLLVVLLLPVGVSAYGWRYTCLNDTHIFAEMTPVVDGTEIPINDTWECPFDCEEEMRPSGAACAPTPLVQNIGFMWIVVILLGVFIFFWWLKS